MKETPGLASGARRLPDPWRPHRGPFIHDGVTGVFVERLPPGAKCVKNDADEAALAAYQTAIHRSQSLPRGRVRSEAATRFAPESIVNAITLSL